MPVTDELYDLVLFVVHSFVRPIATERYALKHHDITVADDPKRLIVTVRNGKTGFRSSNTMPGAVSVYEQIRKRHLNAKGEDYIFLPQYLNRQTAAKIGGIGPAAISFRLPTSRPVVCTNKSAS